MTEKTATILIADLTGQDLAYCVSRANDPADPNRLRRHYGGPATHTTNTWPPMRRFVKEKFGDALPVRGTWQ